MLDHTKEKFVEYTARQIEKEIRQQLDENKVQPLRAAKENG